jgi:hypothetical protein
MANGLGIQIRKSAATILGPYLGAIFCLTYQPNFSIIFNKIAKSYQESVP